MSLKDLTFKGGLHMHDYKELSCNCPLEEGPKPENVIIALHQHTGAPCEPLVAVGDQVKVGQKIGDSKATITAPVHSSVSGVVTKIDEIITSSGVKTKAVFIQSDGKDELGYEVRNDDYTKFTKEEIVAKIREAGIVGLGGAGFPTHVKLTLNPKDTIQYVIVNGAECEPYLTSDQVSMEKYPEKVIIGLEIAMRAMECPKGYVGVEVNKPNAIKALKEACKNHPTVEIASLKTKYPQGDQRRLINSVIGWKLPTTSRCTTDGVQVINSSTAIAIYDAVVTGKPLYEKVVTMTGSAITTPKNILVKLGTPMNELLSFCGGFKEEPGKIIVGGPMMGEAQYKIDSPSIKTMGGIIVLNKEEAKPPVVSACIKCGKCVDVCPVNLMPLYIQKMSLVGRFETAEKMNIMDCIECGTCSYICPAKRPLVEAIRHGKRQIRATMQKR